MANRIPKVSNLELIGWEEERVVFLGSASVESRGKRGAVVRKRDVIMDDDEDDNGDAGVVSFFIAIDLAE